MQNIWDIAIKNLKKLDRKTDSNGLYNAMQISTSENHRIYICCSSFTLGHYIIHYEYDAPSKFKLNNSEILDEKDTILYIKSFDTIDFICQHHNDIEQVTVLYEKNKLKNIVILLLKK